MCGISAILGPHENRELTDLCATLAHRGPNARGTWSHGSVGLAQTRLSVIDVSAAANQPMVSADGRAAIAFNGEIYNYVELREELRRAGVRFATESDTEVLLAILQREGVQALPRLRGMFAFVYVEKEENRVIAARDPFGIKPLYIAELHGRIAIASELKSFLALEDMPREVNLRVLWRFLARGVLDEDGATFFANVQALPPGTALVQDNQGQRMVRYFSLSEHVGMLPESDPVEFQTRFEDAVASHLRSDVPIGTSMSGGLDSTALAATIVALSEKRGIGENFTYTAFTAGFPGHPEDETELARELADALGLRLQLVTPSLADFTSALPQAVYHQDEPFAGPSVLAQWHVMKAAQSAGVTVLLDGQGADEVLAGYSSFHVPQVGQHLRAGKFREAREVLQSKTKGISNPALLSQVAGAALPAGMREGLHSFRPTPAGLRRTFHSQHVHASPRAPRGSTLLRTAQLGAVAHYILPSLLRFEDRNSMAHHIESRVPFLDTPFATYAMRLPDAAKIHGVMRKRILRQTMAGRLPDSIRLNLVKKGFPVPQVAWLGACEPYIRETLESAEFRKRPYWDAAQTLTWLQGRNFHRRQHQLWRLWSTELWIRTFLDQDVPKPTRL